MLERRSQEHTKAVQTAFVLWRKWRKFQDAHSTDPARDVAFHNFLEAHKNLAGFYGALTEFGKMMAASNIQTSGKIRKTEVEQVRERRARANLKFSPVPPEEGEENEY